MNIVEQLGMHAAVFDLYRVMLDISGMDMEDRLQIGRCEFPVLRSHQSVRLFLVRVDGWGR